MKTKSPLLRRDLHRSGLLLAALVLCAAPQAQAQLYTGSASSGLWSTNRWSTSTDGPFTTDWGDNSNAVFLENTAYTFTGGTALGSGTTNIGNVTVGSGASVVFSAISGILGTGGNVRTLEVGANAILDLNNQGLSTNAGTGFIKTGDGVYATGAGDFTGGFTLNGGTVVLRATAGLGSGTGNVLTLSNGVIAANNSRSLANTRFPGGIRIAGNFQLGALSNSYAANARALINQTANISFANNVSLEGANRTITIGGNGNYSFEQAISNGGLTVAAASGATGKLRLSGENTYAGGTTISSGILQIGLGSTSGSVVGDIAVNGELIFNKTGSAVLGNTITGTGTLTKDGAGTLILTTAASAFSGTTSTSGGVLALSNANALSNSVLQLNVDGNRIAFVLPGATDYRLGGLRGTSTNLVIGSNSLTLGKNGETNTSFGGVISGSGGLTKVGSSTQTLTGANIFTGATTVSAGTLELASLTGSAAGSVTSVSVSSGATLLVSQSNQVNNNATVTLSGGTITRGSGVTEVFGSLNLTQSSFLDFGTGTAGALTFGTYTPSVLLTINNFGLGNTLVFGSDLRSTINNTSLFQFSGGFTSAWNDGTSTFTITAIPEPSTYVAAIALLALMLWPLRRRLRGKVS